MGKYIRTDQAYEAAGVEFIPENGGGAGVRLRKDSNSQSDQTANLHLDLSGGSGPAYRK
jgi:hypothetical protein